MCKTLCKEVRLWRPTTPAIDPDLLNRAVEVGGARSKKEAGLLDASILYLSRAIIARKNDYYRLLRAVTAEGA